jgi:hypothetical protein
MTITASAEGTPLSFALSFEKEAMEAVAALRAELGRMVDFQGGGVQKSRDIQKRWGVDFHLSWQVYRVVHSTNPLEACPHIPVPSAMQKLCAAARKHSIREEIVARVEQAYARFEGLVEYFSGDRTRFDSMATRLIGGEADTQAELAHRKSIFEGNRYVLGVELDTYLTVDIFHPAGAGRIDYAGLRMKRQFRRLSSDAPVVIERRRVRAPDSPHHAPPAFPLDAAAFEKYGIPLLPNFCSMSDLRLQSLEEPDGTVITKWMGGGVGCPSALDVTFGEFWRDMPLRERPENRKGMTTSTTFTTPTRLFVRDLFLPRSVFGPPLCEVTRWGHAVEFPKRVEPLELMGLPKLTCHERLTYVGSGASAAHSVGVPQYAEVLKSTCDTLGWDLNDMDVYRIRVEYPLIFTLLVLSLTFVPVEA